MEACDDDGAVVSIPAGADLEACSRQGTADHAAGVRAIDCPYVCGHPVYAWERSWAEAEVRRVASAEAELP